jgi:2-polyprenyl-6-methoxyphenol hydroxylase-like FAD-dependent oxidoreductase
MPAAPDLNPSYDVVVVGARCAGAATALLLARQGLSVIAIDRSPYGSDTLSTHALMRAGVLQLSRWGVLGAIKAAGTPAVTRTTFHYGDEALEVAIKARDGVDALYAPRRTVLDPALADAARAAGATLAFGPRLLSLDRSPGGRVTGVFVEDRDGRVSRIGADIVVGADGQRSAVARLVDARANHVAPHASGVVYGYWKGLAVHGYHWYYRLGVSAGAIETNDGTCVFAAMPAQRFHEEIRQNLEAGYLRVIGEVSPELAVQLSHAQSAGRFHGYPGQPGYLRQSWGPGWALVGDAGYFKDPLTAHGITDALRDGELLARAIGRGTDAALAEYQSVRDELSLGMLTATDEIASFAWTLDSLRERHRFLVEEMTREARALAALDQASALSPA